jgi:hypothetical protein
MSSLTGSAVLASAVFCASSVTTIPASAAHGNGIRQDSVQAVEWFRRAAAQGLAQGQFQLGVSFEDGIGGVTQDLPQAAEWYRRAADQDFAAAQNNLGLLYLNGNSVPQDVAQAFQWFRKAAEQGPPDAQYNLGMAYFNGAGGTVDYVEALKWFALAAIPRSGIAVPQYENARDAIATRMTLEQVTEAQRRAREWFEAYTRGRQ